MMTSKEFDSCLSHKAQKSGLVDEPANENVLENKDMLNRHFNSRRARPIYRMTHNNVDIAEHIIFKVILELKVDKNLYAP